MSENRPAPSIMAPEEEALLQHGKVRPPTRLGSQGRIGKFEIIKPIGHGSMGHVFAATEPVTGATVAVKILRSEFVEDSRMAETFLREARHMYQLCHPSILKVLEVSGPDEGPFFVMPLVTTGSLADRIAKGASDYDSSLSIATQVAEGLAHAHSKGLIHRDLKPANILIDDTGHALITDFGLVRSYLGDSMVNGSRSAAEGTPAYMSPSVAAGEAEDTRCDIYAFGAVLYEMLSGTPPYVGANANAVMDAVLKGPPTPVSSVNPKAPATLVSIAEWCMARELRDRYASMNDVLADLQRIQAGQKPRGPHGSGITATRPRKLLLSAAIVLLLLAATYGVLRLSGCTNTSPQHKPAEAAEHLTAADAARVEAAYISILKDNPNHVESLLGLVKLVEARREVPRAVAIYRQIIATTPTSTEAREGLFRLQMRIGHLNPARAELERWLQTDPHSETAKQLMEELEKQEAESGVAPPARPEDGRPPPRRGRMQRGGPPPRQGAGVGPRWRQADGENSEP